MWFMIVRVSPLASRLATDVSELPSRLRCVCPDNPLPLRSSRSCDSRLALLYFMDYHDYAVFLLEVDNSLKQFHCSKVALAH